MAQSSSFDSKETSTTNCTENSSAAGEENTVIKIKQEKFDLEIENKIQLLKNEIKVEPSDDKEARSHEANGHTGKPDHNETDDDEEDSNGTDSSDPDQENDNDEEEGGDEKKNIEPVKSSNEILTELFKVFNAAPPEELLDDKNLIKKAKKHKKEKKKKNKKSKCDDSGSDTDEGEALGGEKHKHKKSKKKHKHKHKEGSKEKTKDRDKSKEKGKLKDRDKERAKSKDKEKHKKDKKNSERAKSRERAKSKDRDKKQIESVHKLSSERKRLSEKEEITDSNCKRKKTEDNSYKKNSFYNGFGENENSKDRDEIIDKVRIKTEPRERKTRRYSEDEHISEISLSDEETYLKEKETRRDYSKRKAHNSFYDSSRDKEKERYHHHHERSYSRDRYRDRERDNKSRGFSKRYYSRYSRSRSRSRSRDLGIDKKRLLEIARKNAISMFKRGNLPGCDNMSQEIKDKVLLKMRYGGRTVEDLTEFCKKISNGENLSDLSSDEDSDVDKTGNTKAFHHPFQLKEREPIVMHIRNSKPIVPVVIKTEEQTKAITMQFPVSSGQQHRLTEHWVPVETKDILAPLPALPAAAPSTTIFKNIAPKNALGKPMPLAEEQEPAFKPVTAPNIELTQESPALLQEVIVPAIPTPPAVVSIPKPVSPPAAIVNATEAIITVPTPAPTFVPDVPVPSTNNSIFPQTNCPNLDVSSIISKRLNAMRRLQENPMDSEAIKMMYNSQREMSTWASSKHLPGQFTGSTGVNVLKPNELNSGPQVWARRDQLTSTKPVTGGMGMHLLQKMGWKPGEGLGREKNGSLQPLLLDVKLDKRGLVAQGDGQRKGMPVRRKGSVCSQNAQTTQQNIESKHPVCLLNELTSKRKWTPPLYTLVNENGPSHSKMFLFSVQVNGQTFTPDKACNTKKEAKMIAAKHCLQEIGILPKC